MNPPAIETDELSFGYSSIPVIENATFSIEKGEYVVLFGPNGGGKTTLLNLLMGFLKPTRGAAKLFGQSPKAACHQISFVPQYFAFDPQFPISVIEVVLTGCLSLLPWHGHYLKEHKKRSLEALKQVQMHTKKNAAFTTLSGGQKQRVLIARALVSNPQLLLLDEPTSSVDPKAQNQIYTLLRSLKGSMTIVMVTHELKTSLEQADRIFCVQRSVTPMSAEQVCTHFALGLYHPTEGPS